MSITQVFRKIYKFCPRILGGLTLIMVTLSACRKEKIEFIFTELHSGIDNDLNSIYFTDDTTGYACGGDRYYHGDILKTLDGGKTWMAQGENLDKTLYQINFTAHDTGFISGFDGRIYRTYNAGASWDLYQLWFYSPMHDIMMADKNNGLCCGGDGYKTGFIYRTQDGGNVWSMDSFDLEFRSVYMTDQSTGFASGYGSIFKTSDGGVSWQHTSASGDFFHSIYFVNGETGFAVGYEGTILKTTDAGNTWDKIRNGNNLLQSTLHFNRVTFRDESNGYIIGEKGCFLKTSDGGEHWNTIKNAPDVDWNGIFLMKEGGYLCGAGGKMYRFLE